MTIVTTETKYEDFVIEFFAPGSDELVNSTLWDFWLSHPELRMTEINELRKELVEFKEGRIVTKEGKFYVMGYDEIS